MISVLLQALALGILLTGLAGVVRLLQRRVNPLLHGPDEDGPTSNRSLTLAGDAEDTASYVRFSRAP